MGEKECLRRAIKINWYKLSKHKNGYNSNTRTKA